ncbi:GNAT family N-acetyltransferase [Streptomyces sodiiphilus]|uniref:GNAT family N-acetyltransferase n=1 Tax=Streptomyces sodiiphilus TaxID=226217 RepID=A0ABN2NQK2_9ACTN
MGMSVTIGRATGQDAEQILKLQYLCYQSEAELYGDYRIEPLTQTLDALRTELAASCVLVARLGDEIVGSVRGTVDEDGTGRIGTLVVHPRMQRHGLGKRLMRAIEARLAEDGAATRYRLSAGHRSDATLRLYRTLGYAPVATEEVSRRLRMITLEKHAGETGEPALRQPMTAGA